MGDGENVYQGVGGVAVGKDVPAGVGKGVEENVGMGVAVSVGNGVGEGEGLREYSTSNSGILAPSLAWKTAYPSPVLLLNFSTSVINPEDCAVLTSAVTFHDLYTPTKYETPKDHESVGFGLKLGLLFHEIPCSLQVLSEQ